MQACCVHTTNATVCWKAGKLLGQRGVGKTGNRFSHSRADNLVLVKFEFSALSAPLFFRHLVLELVLNTSNSAHLVLLKSNEHYAK